MTAPGQSHCALILAVTITEVVDDNGYICRCRGSRQSAQDCGTDEGGQVGANGCAPGHSALLWRMRLFFFNVSSANSMSESNSGSARVGVITVRLLNSRWIAISGSIPRS